MLGILHNAALVHILLLPLVVSLGFLFESQVVAQVLLVLLENPPGLVVAVMENRITLRERISTGQAAVVSVSFLHFESCMHSILKKIQIQPLLRFFFFFFETRTMSLPLI